MPPQRSSKAGGASAAADRYRKPPKKAKPELPLSVKLEKKWKGIRDQIQDGFPEHALKNCQKVLELDPSNQLGVQTYIQLLLSLDRYRAALEFIEADGARRGARSIERAYALYKLGREAEAGQVVEELRQNQNETGGIADDDDAAAAAREESDRTLDVLDAQIQYRLERFEDAQLMYEDLLATVDEDSPERDDLQTNLSASVAHTDFIASIPSLLGELSSSSEGTRIPPVDVLEATPIAPLVSAHPLYRTRNNTKVVVANMSTSASARAQGAAVGPAAAASSSSSSSNTAPRTAGTVAGSSKKSRSSKKTSLSNNDTKRVKAVKLPPSIAALPEDKRPGPDPERWLPKRERKGYAEVLAAKEREKEKRRLKARKKLEATLTQGSDGPASSSSAAAGSSKPLAPSNSSSGGGGGQGRGSNASNKKKRKGGR